jgi:hypothetical protein
VLELEIRERLPSTLENINSGTPGRCCQKILAITTTYSKTSMADPLGVLSVDTTEATKIVEEDIDGGPPWGCCR